MNKALIFSLIRKILLVVAVHTSAKWLDDELITILADVVAIAAIQFWSQLDRSKQIAEVKEVAKAEVKAETDILKKG